MRTICVKPDSVSVHFT